MNTRRRLKHFLLLVSPFLICAIAVSSRVLKNGSFFGLDFNLFQPDGRFYTWLTYIFLGKPSIEAWQLVQNFYSNLHMISNHYVSMITPVNDLGLRHDIQFRPLYPLLSTPFVAVFGAKGMLVVPCACYLVCSYLAFFFFKSNIQRIMIVVGLGILSASPFISRGFITNYTDGLLALIVFAVFILLQKHPHRFSFVLILSILGEATRPSEPIWILFAIFFYRSTKNKKYILFALFHAGFFLYAFLFNSDSVGAASRDGITIMDRVISESLNVVRILFFDSAELLVLDKLLFLFLATYLVMLMKRPWSSIIYKCPASILIVTILMSAWNGGIGTGWRYELPAIFPMLISMVETFTKRPPGL